MIKDRSPSDYVKEVIQRLGSEENARRVLMTHFINEDAYAAMLSNDYERFLSARSRDLNKEIRRRVTGNADLDRDVLSYILQPQQTKPSLIPVQAMAVVHEAEVQEPIANEEEKGLEAVPVAQQPDTSARVIKGSRRLSANFTSNLHVPEQKVLKRDQVKSILAEAHRLDRRLYAVCVVMANHGLLMSETMHLKCGDVRDGKLYFRQMKIQKEVRQEIDIKPEVEALLKQLIGQRGEKEWLFIGQSGTCPHCEGGHYSMRSIQRKWDIALRVAKLYVTGRGIDSLRSFAKLVWVEHGSQDTAAVL